MSEEAKAKKFRDFLKKRWPVIAGAAAGLAIGLAIVLFVIKPGARYAVSDIPQNTQDPASNISLEITGVDELSLESENKGPRLNAAFEALNNGNEGLSPESSFQITLPDGYDQEFVKQSLTVNPSIEYTLEEKGKSFILTPKQDLEPNTVYSFKLKNDAANLNDSWAFQTRRAFKLESTLPGDKSTLVPVNTGIEFVFSHEGIKAIDGYFSISPEVTGRFEYHKNTAVFVPDSLRNDTIYTVTLKKGVGLEGSDMKIEDDCVFQFQTEPVERNNIRDDYFYVFNNFNTLPSDVAPYFDVAVPEEEGAANVKVCVYRYQDADTYLANMEEFNKLPYWAYQDEEKILPKVDQLEKVLEQEIPITTVEEPWFCHYLILPEPLPEGHYFITFAMDDHKAYCFSQINDTLAYINVSADKAICWLNDNVTGEIISGATVEGPGISPVTSDQNGIAVIEGQPLNDPEKTYTNLKITREGHPSLIATISNSTYYNDYNYYDYEYDNYYYSSYSSSAKKNWLYFFLDRSVYLPSDTVSMWGLVKPRNGGEPYKKLTLCLEGYSYSPELGYAQATLKSMDVDVGEFGAFKSSFSYDGLDSGSYELVLKSGDKVLNSRYFYVEPYVKPQYVISTASDKTAVSAGEEATFNVQVKFFEGTPVSGLSLDYRAYGDLQDKSGSTEGTFKLDESGQYSVKVKAAPEPADSESDGYPRWRSLNFTNTNPEEANLYAEEGVYVFQRDILLVSNGTVTDGTANLHFETNKVDIEAVNAAGSLYDDNWKETYIGEAYDAKLSVTVYEEYWVGEEIGTYYDFISKHTYKKYNYKKVTNTLDSFEVGTVNGKADYSYTIPQYNKDHYYRFDVKTNDMKNRTVSDTGYLWGSDQYSYSSNEFDPSYSLRITDEDNAYKPGETVSTEVLKDDLSFSLEPNGRILYMAFQEGILSYDVVQSTTHQFAYDKSLIPNSYVYAVLFDGRNIKTTYIQGIRYDTADEKLNIAIRTDKPEYRPGEDVEVTFDVTDSAGNPCSAQINLSVVDEAYFALFNQSVDILSDIYQSVFSSGIEKEFISYIPYNRHYYNGAECGEGGDEAAPVRKNFKDTAFFECVQTDSSGKGKLSFKLPDNLTSWRLTYQAVTKDLKAGNGQININAKLPFFLQLVSANTFLEGDAPVFQARAFGTELKSGEPVNYTYEINDGKNVISSGKASGNAADMTLLDLPKLNEGNYTITVRAENGGHKDAVEREIRVVKNILEGTRTRYFNVSSDLKLDFTNSMTTLTFYNRNLLAYYNMLWNLCWSWGDRIDQVLSEKIAREQLTKFFGEDFTYYYSAGRDITPYQQGDGGISLLTYGSSDPELSAKVASLDSSFDKYKLKDYFYSIVNDDQNQSPINVAASYWGLAALHEPVLFRMNDYLRTLVSDPQFSLNEKLYIALAFAEIGDFDTAERLYSGVLNQYKAEVDSMIYLETNDKDNNLIATSLCSILALKLDMPDKNGMFTYLTRKSGNEVLINLERLVYITNVLPQTTQKSGFTVSYGGKTENVQLDGIKSYTMMLMPGELKNVKISDVQGSPVVMASYKGPLAELQDNRNQMVTVSRRYLVDGKETTNIKTTDLVTVELTVKFNEDAPEGYYDITDVLPAGLRYSYCNFLDDPEGYYFSWADPAGQLVKMGCYYSKKAGPRYFKYQARVVAPGIYTADNACVKDSESDACGFSDRTAVTIGD